MIKSTVCALALGLCAAGCGGGGGGSSADGSPQLALLDSYLAYEESDFRAARPAELSGTARMNGLLGVALDDDSVVLGDAEAVFDFETSTITGGADNFNEYTATDDISSARDARLVSAYDGSLAITRGEIFGDTFEVDMAGRLSGESDFGRGREAFEADIDVTTFAGGIGIERSTGDRVAEALLDVDAEFTFDDGVTSSEFFDGDLLLQE